MCSHQFCVPFLLLLYFHIITVTTPQRPGKVVKAVSEDSQRNRAHKRIHSLIKTLIALFISLCIAAIGLELDRRDIALVDTLDQHVGDWRIALGSPQAPDQRSDIAIVLLNEDTLLDYESRSPIDRTLLAELVQSIDAAKPRLIALDFIFDRPTSADHALIAAVKKATSPIVFSAIDPRAGGAGMSARAAREGLVRQAELLTAMGHPYGHVMLERRKGYLAASDAVVRYIPSPHVVGELQPKASKIASVGDLVTAASEQPVAAFVDVIAQEAGIKHTPENNVIAWLRSPQKFELFETIYVPRHNPGEGAAAIKRISSFREQIKDRIVLIGATLVDRDQHRTPLSVIEDATVPGVMIHAQALAQRIDGDRDVIVWSWYGLLPLVGSVALARARRFSQSSREATPELKSAS